MKARVADRVIRKKLPFEPVNHSRHLHYRYVSEGSVFLSLPVIVAMSHGSSELTLQNEKGLADAIGMSLGEFRAFVACHIGSRCARIMLAVSLLKFAKTRLERYGITARDQIVALQDTCKVILAEVPEPTHSCSADEKRSLDALKKELSPLCKDEWLGQQAIIAIRMCE